MHRLIVILGLLLLAPTVKSQDFVSVDKETYKLYLDKQWDELIRAGRLGLKQDNDYYYLRMRIGIAFYEKKNYKASQIHFRRALELNEGDPVASEYLYFAYLLAGQTQQAEVLAKDFTPYLEEKVNIAADKFADIFSVEYLYNFNDTEDILSNPENYFSGLPYGYQLITLNFSNLNVMLHHELSPGIFQPGVD
jgi:tetratricopeptide (TPR) repeat protein